MDRSKEQVAALTRRLEKSRGQNAKLVEQVKESVKTSTEHFDRKAEDNEMRDAELGELRKVKNNKTCHYVFRLKTPQAEWNVTERSVDVVRYYCSLYYRRMVCLLDVAVTFTSPVLQYHNSVAQCLAG